MKGYKQLNQEQRYTIAQLLKRGASQREIARTIEVSVSTVSREIKRNKGKHTYRAAYAHMLAQERIEWRQHPRRFTGDLRLRAEELLRHKQWSPKQIVGRLRLEGVKMVGKSTLYKWLHQDKRAGGNLYSFCRHGLKYKRQRLAIPKNNKKRGRYKSILERPEIIDKQGRMRDMEMDLIIGASPNEAILTMVDRKTDYIFIDLLTHGRKSKPLARVVNKRLAFLKRRGQCHSITTDNGSEFSAYRSVERSLGIPVYFARPYRSTDKPHIEHANALIRQYLPKHASFAKLTTKEIKDIECTLNNRPRKKLGYRTPHEVFYLNLLNECCTS